MSYIKVITNNYDNPHAVNKLLNYLIRSTSMFKKEHSNIYRDTLGLSNVNIDEAILDFNMIKKIFDNEQGRQIHHFVVSIPYKNTKQKSNVDEDRLIYMRTISIYLQNYIFQQGFQVFYVIHLDHDENVHSHFIINSVNYKNGNRIPHEKVFYNQLLQYLRFEFNKIEWERVIYGNL